MAEEKVRILIIHPRNVNGGNQIFGANTEYEVDEPIARNLIANGKAKLLKGKLRKDPVTETGKMTNQEFLTFVQRNAAEIFQMMQLEADKINNSPNSEVVPASSETSNETKSETSENSADTSDENTGTGEGSETGNESGEDEIPEDFPGREVLAKNGITTMSAIPRDKDELMKLDQMTGRVANQIGVKLGE